MNYKKPRIALDSRILDAIIAMAEDNPGAIDVCAQLVLHTKHIDPDNAFKDLGALMSLDSLGIYGSQIWILYSDVCRRDLTNMVGLLRAWQLGHVKEVTLMQYLADYKAPVEDIKNYVGLVRQHLPRFGHYTISE